LFPNPVHMVSGGIEVSKTVVPPEMIERCFSAFETEELELSFDIYSNVGDEDKRLRRSKELKSRQPERFAPLYQMLDEFVLQSLYARGEGYSGSVSRQQFMIYSEGAGAGLHVDDQFKPPQQFGRNKYVMHLLNQFAGLLYISSDDLEGGELVFPTHDVSVKPLTGTLVAFPSNYLFPHLVTPVTRGKRIAIARHYYVKDTPAV
jgi:predicted 2-oxoglutarate/Fe(II)-dependent dioxygenase YbiX